MDRSDAKRVVRTLEGFTAGGLGDVKALKVALKGLSAARGKAPDPLPPRCSGMPDQVGFASIAQAVHRAITTGELG
jgi:hypothetical protein